MSLHASASATTVSPLTPDKQFRSAAYLVHTSTPPSLSGSRARSRSPGAALGTLDPRYTSSMTDGNATSGNDSTNGDGEWSSAVGRASVAGKSGRVIERLMGDVDKLKRELNLAQARVEEEQLRGVSAREALDSLRGTKENLEAICETNRNIISRRDRKIDELKAELDAERSKRTDAEKSREGLTVDLESLRTKTDKEVYKATEIAGRAQAEYDTLSKSLKRMKADYDRQIAQMRKELDVIQNDRTDERRRVKKAQKNQDELNGRVLKDRHLVEDIRGNYESYKKTRDDSVRDMAQQIADGDAANEQLYKDMEETLNRMRWVMNIKQNVPSIRQLDDADAKEALPKRK